MLTHRHLSFPPLSATVLQQFVCLSGWYERFGAWVQLKLHSQRHQVRCRLVKPHELRPTSACSPSRSLTLASLPEGLVPPRPGGSRGCKHIEIYLTALGSFGNLSIKVIKRDTRSFLAFGGLHEDKLCDTLQAMAPNNVETVYQTSLLHIESNLDPLGLLSPTHGQRSQQ